MESINNVQALQNDRRLENEMIMDFLASEANMLYRSVVALYRRSVYFLHREESYDLFK